MLTVTIFATIVAEMLPVSNNTPLIGQLIIKSLISAPIFQCKCFPLTFNVYQHELKNHKKTTTVDWTKSVRLFLVFIDKK